MKRFGVNGDRVISLWESRLVIGRRKLVHAGLADAGVPNHQPFQIAWNCVSEWALVVVPRYAVTRS